MGVMLLKNYYSFKFCIHLAGIYLMKDWVILFIYEFKQL